MVASAELGQVVLTLRSRAMLTVPDWVSRLTVRMSADVRFVVVASNTTSWSSSPLVPIPIGSLGELVGAPTKVGAVGGSHTPPRQNCRLDPAKAPELLPSAARRMPKATGWVP